MLSRAADHGKLWAGSALVLALTGNARNRRAALRGTIAVAISSATVNTVAKWMVSRDRPLADAVPVIRRLRRVPSSASFPSGHAASAAAFVTGAAMESPKLGAALAPVAASVAFSRVYTGVHYPSDVLAGAALGVGAGLLTRRWWPTLPSTRAADADEIGLPRLPNGKGLHLVVNPVAGPVLSVDGPVERLRAVLPDAHIAIAGEDGTLQDLLNTAARQASAAHGAVGVAGGDGTVNAAVRAALDHRVPLAVLPAGTLNHFAADLGIDGPEDVAAALADGTGSRVDVGLLRTFDRPGSEADEVYFANNAGIGVYPDLVRARELMERKIGKWPAMLLASARAIRSAEAIELTVRGMPRRVWLVFAGNGRYAPDGLAPSRRTNLADGRLDVRIVDAARPYSRTRLLLAAVTGTLGTSQVHNRARLGELSLGGLSGARAACDGELIQLRDRVEIRTAHDQLRVYRYPAPADSRAGRLRAVRANRKGHGSDSGGR